ncbi:hypothetical protein BD779DRAFT_1698187 [Infundibulicybe gibba]|nr:hypothetical protein BD779DRAFT_1698187 [Infundibulicybe gibba]
MYILHLLLLGYISIRHGLLFLCGGAVKMAIPAHSRKQGGANGTWHDIWFMSMHGWWWVTRGNKAWWDNCPTGGQICGAADNNVAGWPCHWGGQGVWTMLSRDDGTVGTSTICPESAARTGPATCIGVWIGHHAWAVGWIAAQPRACSGRSWDGIRSHFRMVGGGAQCLPALPPFCNLPASYTQPSSNIDIP